MPCNFSSSWATWIEPFRRAQFARAAEIRVTGKLAETSINSSSNLTYFVARREMNFDEVRFFESISFPFVQVFPSCASRGRCPRGNVIDRWAKKREERVAWRKSVEMTSIGRTRPSTSSMGTQRLAYYLFNGRQQTADNFRFAREEGQRRGGLETSLGNEKATHVEIFIASTSPASFQSLSFPAEREKCFRLSFTTKDVVGLRKGIKVLLNTVISREEMTSRKKN